MKVKDVFKDKSDKTIEYMEQLVLQIEKDYGHVEASWMITLQLIADSIEIYFKAVDDIKNRGIIVKDDRDRPSKNPSVAISNVTLQNVVKLVSNFGLTPLSKSKMKQLDLSENTLQDILSC